MQLIAMHPHHDTQLFRLLQQEQDCFWACIRIALAKYYGT